MCIWCLRDDSFTDEEWSSLLDESIRRDESLVGQLGRLLSRVKKHHSDERKEKETNKNKATNPSR